MAKCKECGREFKEWRPIPGSKFIPLPREWRDRCRSCREKIIR